MSKAGLGFAPETSSEALSESVDEASALVPVADAHDSANAKIEFDKSSLENGKAVTSEDGRAIGKRRQRRRRDVLLGGAAILALILAVSVFSEGRKRGPNVDSLKVAQESAAAVASRRADSARIADSIAKAASDSAEITNRAPAAIEITPSIGTLGVNESRVFGAVVRDADEKELPDSVHWRSSDPRIASVDSLTGRVRGRAAGPVTIYARVGNIEEHATILVSGTAKPSTGGGPVAVQVPPTKTPAPSSERALADSVEHAFDVAIRDPIGREGKVEAVGRYFRPDFEKQLREWIGSVPGAKLRIRRRDFVVDTAKARVSFWLEVDVTVGKQPERALIEYREMGASLDRRVSGLIPTKIAPVKELPRPTP
jgi:hypothetical protein